MSTKVLKETAPPLRVAVLGAGYISGFHIRALRTIPGVKLTALCDTDLPRAREICDRWNIPGCYDSLPHMLKEEALDVVHILVPPAFHASSAVACLNANVNVFIEKPAATDSESCLLIAHTARKSRLLAGVNHNARFHPVVLDLAERIRNCEFGAIEHVVSCLSTPLRQLSACSHTHWMFREPLNILLEQAPHPLSQIQLLLGNVRSAQAKTTTPIRLKTGIDFCSSWQISLTCERGTAQLYLSFGKEFPENWLHVIGQDASAFADLRRNTVQLHGKTRFIEPIDYLLDGVSNSSRLFRNSAANALSYCAGFLGMRSSADVFFSTMRLSIQAFYNGLRSSAGPPVDIRQATDIISACEDIAAAAGVLSAPAEHLFEVPLSQQEGPFHVAHR